MFTFESKLQCYAILVLSNLHLILPGGHGCVVVFHHLSARDACRVWLPLLQVFADELVVNTLEDPMAHEMLLDIA